MRPGVSVFCCSAIAAGIAAIPGAAAAHGVAGQRFFPTTFAVDDPFMNDEFSVLAHSAQASGQAPGSRVRTTSIDVGYAKTIFPGFGFELDEQYLWVDNTQGGSSSGFANLAFTLKYQFLTSDPHETILSFGVSDEIGGTGAARVGADSFSTVAPAFYFGKGFGDLPDSLPFLRPLAITGVVGPSFPTESATHGSDNPSTFVWAFTVQYSLMYLQSAVKDVGLGAPFDRLVTLVELPFETCLDAGCGGRTTWTVNPGVVWVGRYMELGAAAEIPVNTLPGADIGVFVVLNLFLDDLLPGSIGRPIFP